MDAAQERIVYLDIESAGLEFWRPIIQIAAIAVDSQLNVLETIELKILFRESHADPRALTANKYDPQSMAAGSGPQSRRRSTLRWISAKACHLRYAITRWLALLSCAIGWPQCRAI